MAFYLMAFFFANLNVVVEDSDYNNYFIAPSEKVEELSVLSNKKWHLFCIYFNLIAVEKIF